VKNINKYELQNTQVSHVFQAFFKPLFKSSIKHYHEVASLSVLKLLHLNY